MKTTNLFRLFVLLSLAGSTARAATASEAQLDALLARGRYLVNHVAGCGDCHTPRNERGEVAPGSEFAGAVLPFAPTVPMPWAPAAPKIAGLEGYTSEQAVKFLMTGERPSGVPPRQPMPPYRLNEEDARAVVAYLKSLAPRT